LEAGGSRQLAKAYERLGASADPQLATALSGKLQSTMLSYELEARKLIGRIAGGG
jgi:hypothetical protein